MKITSPVSTSGNTDPSNLGISSKPHPNQLKVSIVLQVVFGSPSRVCAGSGVCKMLPQNVKIPDFWLCPVWTGQLHWHAATKSLQLSLPREQFADTDIDHWFSGGHFLVDEDFPLPLWLTKLLGKNHYAIPAGCYPCEIATNLAINLKIARQKKYPHPADQQLLKGA